ncbi:hypothetical protein OQE61_13165 [Cetobacterium somerae]|uniref:hypothetical protein n=1 Tax=Cetobacterium somerae TaxID=188913 RepID=UPI0022523228|nr:hypothetical protein [Cetobacterium somerae]MCX3068448.1 hypothetical protein [Cetobacterium somerae]
MNRTNIELNKKLDYKTYIEQKFRGSSKYYEESLEIAKNFLVLYSMYEGSFNLYNRSLTIRTVIEKINIKNKNIKEIEEIYDYFIDRYKNDESKIERLFEGRDEAYEKLFREYFEKESVTNLEKQIFVAIVANRYRNNTLHATKKYFNWYKYRVEFDYINTFLYLWLKNSKI